MAQVKSPSDYRTFADLSGMAALVTGSSSGIGRAIALELARGGADVLIHCRQSDKAAHEVAAECRALGRESRVMLADLAQEADLAAFVSRAWNELTPLDIWINNAGADLLTGAEARIAYADKLRRLLDVDVRGTMLLS